MHNPGGMLLSGECHDTHMPKTLGGTYVFERARGLPASPLFVKVTFTSWENLPAHRAVKKAHLSFVNNSWASLPKFFGEHSRQKERKKVCSCKPWGLCNTAKAKLKEMLGREGSEVTNHHIVLEG